MTLQDHVARALYERDRAKGSWDDAPEVVREVFIDRAGVALSATAGWLELVCRTRVVGGSLSAVRSLHGVAQVIRRALGEDRAPLPQLDEPEPDLSPGRAALREVLEGYGG